ncbi:discoidin domain-containing protein [Eubacterium sp.]
MKGKESVFSKGKILMILSFVCIVMQAFFVSDIFAADINNIGEPVYRAEKNLAGTDAFVYAYNVKDYGADSNGNNDNTEIFQKLLNKTYELGGGIVYVPSGRYKVTGTLKIPKGVTLRGDWQKPTAGQGIPNGTVLMAYTGRGGDEYSKPFIEMEPETGCMEMTIWYPEQDGDNVQKYSPTIRLGVDQYTGGYFGNEYTTVKNVTLLNSYIGILFHYENGGASPVINGVYGTPLYKGIDMDRLVDVGRIENIDFTPDYWSGSGIEGAPAKGSNFEKYIYNNATGILMKRNDWSYTCYVNISGYNTGYKAEHSIEGNQSSPNGNHYKFNLKNCKNGIVFKATNTVGILFDDINIYNCESGIVLKDSTSDVVQFSKTKISATKYAVNMDKTSSTKLLMYDNKINTGIVNVDGGTFMCVGSEFNNKAPQIAIGSLGRISLSANTFKNGKQIVNNSIYKSEDSNADAQITPVPDFPDNKAQFQSHMPSNLTVYNVTKAPYYVENSKNHGGGRDCTQAIQNALNDAAANGGGIVFLPSGHYRMDGTIIIPANVELRGATDLSTVPHGSGAILESYANKGNKNGTPFIRVSANSGIRGVIVNYPEQKYSLTNGEYYPTDYPYTMQGMGDNIYVINVGIRAATGGLDLATYQCNNHYVDFLAGHVNKECVKVGKGCKNGIINNLMFNTIVYGCGSESKFGSFPNSPNGDNGPVYTQQLRDLEFLILGDCENETLYNCFPYGAYIGTKIVNEGNGGPQNLISMGLGIDGSRKSIYFGSGLTGKMDFINSQIVSLNNEQPITRYIEAESNSNFTVNMYNTDLWGYPEKGVLLGSNVGNLNMYTANFQMRGYNGSLTTRQGSNLKIVASNFNSHSSAFSSGANNISLVSTIADYTNNEKNSFAQCINCFSNALEIDGNSQAANAINRNGWSATASVNGGNGYLSLDGNLDTQWTTAGAQTPGQWYQVDMKQNQNFDLIVTNLGKTGDVPRAYKILVSNDGYNWREVASGENNNVYSVGDQNARYVRIEQTGTESHWWAIYEFYVLKSNSYDVGEGEVVEPQEPEQPSQPEEPTKPEQPSQTGDTTKYSVTDSDVVTAGIYDDANAFNGKNIGNMHLDGAQFTFNNIYGGKKGGKAKITVHYATNDTGAALKMSANGEEKILELASTNGWSNYTGEVSAQVNLKAGKNNTLTFAHYAGGVNVDYITVTLLDEEKEEFVPVNVAKGKNATVSGYESDETLGKNAFDGDEGTRWSSNFADDAWIMVDLAKKYNINKVVLNWEAAYGESYNILVSTDGTNWTTVKKLKNQGGGIDTITFDAVEAKYVKIQGVKRALPYGYSLWEMEVYNTDSLVSDDTKPSTPEVPQEPETTYGIVSNNRVAYSSGNENDTMYAGLAFDGDIGTRWSSNYTDDAWITVDLGKVYQVDKVVLNWEAAYGESYNILVSTDGNNWTTVKEMRNQNGGEDTVTFNATNARYVRMQGVKRALPYGYSLWEMNVYGK